MKCTTCGKENEDDQLFCTDCGQELKEQDEFVIEQPKGSNIKHCPRCQALYDDSFEFCGSCGYAFKNPQETLVNQQVLSNQEVQISENEPKKNMLWLIVLVAASIMAFILGYFLGVR